MFDENKKLAKYLIVFSVIVGGSFIGFAIVSFIILIIR